MDGGGRVFSFAKAGALGAPGLSGGGRFQPRCPKTLARPDWFAAIRSKKLVEHVFRNGLGVTRNRFSNLFFAGTS